MLLVVGWVRKRERGDERDQEKIVKRKKIAH